MQSIAKLLAEDYAASQKIATNFLDPLALKLGVLDLQPRKIV